jgi:isoleucyl-tRNA synthetase
MVEAKRVFEQVSSKVNFPQLEEAVLRRWQSQDTFHRVDEVRSKAPLFVFYEGPPTANGSPGIHHVLSRAFKDAIIRYKTMRGFRPLRRGGWDTHGLPVELEVEKELGLSSKQEIEQLGIEEFNRRCRESVFRYVQEWEAMTERAGVWLDMKDAYVTYDNSYIETGWWLLKQLWDQGLVYEGYKVTPHCPRCVTSLSSHEVAQGYQEDTPDPSVVVRFRLSRGQPGVQGLQHESVGQHPVLQKLGLYDSSWAEERPAFLAWTTTPWTLTAHTALAVAPNEEYVLAQAPAGRLQERLIVAKSLLERTLGEGWQVLESFTGQELVELYYAPPFPSSGFPGHTYRVVHAPFVTTDEGTGIVHTAPAYGADDQDLSRAFSLPTVHTVDTSGILQGSFPGAGKFVKDADEELMQDLEARGLLFKRETVRHTYPFCWRCGTPLLYYAKVSWYIRTTEKKDGMVAGNQAVNWYPEHIKEGRFGEWLRNNVDWAISRERYWGTPIPIWRCGEPSGCGHIHCVGGVAELEDMATAETKHLVDGLDLHRPYVDRVELACPQCGGIMRRVPEVADAWYDSGAMPFAQWRYPVTLNGPGGAQVTLRNPQDLIQSPFYPADYITEAVDQTRGWFYSLLALSTLVAGEPSYKNVICLGLVLDEQGEKMSKSKGNAADPWLVLQEQGADALRWYLFTSAPAGSNRRFSSSLVQESLRRFLLTVWNTFSFFVTYANLDEFDPQAHASFWKGEVGGPSLASAPLHELDRWAISELNGLVKTVTREMDAYNPTDAGRRIEEFVESLSNWYVRRSRRRFWKSENDEDKAWAYVTLYTCLMTVSKLMAPLAPFVADEIYRVLAPWGATEGHDNSVHLYDFPVADDSLIDQTLEGAVRLAMRVASLGRAARSKAKVKVRQPLARVLVQPRSDELPLLPMVETMILDELNVKAVEVAAGDALAAFQVRPNLPALGPKYGQQVRHIREALAAADPQAIAARVRTGKGVTVGEFTLEPDEVLVSVEDRPGLAVAMEGVGGLVVAVDTVITRELEDEGMARELVHRLQNMRRDAGLKIDDRITSYVLGADDRMRLVLEQHGAYIRQETLSIKLLLEPASEGAHAQEQTVEGVRLTLGVERAQLG